jgi:hypothetical protein
VSQDVGAPKPLNITAKRLEVLRFLSKRQHYRVSSLAEALSPRATPDAPWRSWTAQGAARWGGGVVAPLEKAKLVCVDRFVSSGVGMVRITEAGLKVLAEADEAESKAQLRAAIESGE